MRLVCFVALVAMARVLHADWLWRNNAEHVGDICWATRDPLEGGYCAEVSDCPRALKNINETGNTKLAICSINNFTEIICCPDTPRACREQLQNRCKIGFGGIKIDWHEFTYTVALGYETDDGIEYACGGTLLSSRHVLTAAHCVHNQQKRVPVVVQMGMTNISGSEDTAEFHGIKDIIWHPGYKVSKYYNDIAILRLNTSASCNPEVERIELPQLEHLEMLLNDDLNLTVAGWGRASADAPLSDDLISIEQLSLADRDCCAKSYAQSYGLPNGLAEYMVCVTDRNANRTADTCLGHSGGPLLMETESGRVLIGVMSFGQNCGDSAPGVYTAIPPFLDWIGRVVCEYPELEKKSVKSV